MPGNAPNYSCKSIIYGLLPGSKGTSGSARTAPAAMIFVPCENGISHAEIENATPEDLAAGCNVLLHAMLQIDGS